MKSYVAQRTPDVVDDIGGVYDVLLGFISMEYIPSQTLRAGLYPHDDFYKTSGDQRFLIHRRLSFEDGTRW